MSVRETPPELIERVIALARDGMSYGDIGKEVHYCRSHVGAIVARHAPELANPRPGRRSARARQASELRAQGWSAPRIAAWLEYSAPNSVFRAIRSYKEAQHE